MGYSHYWAVDTDAPEWPESFGRLMLDAKRITDACQDLSIGLAATEVRERRVDGRLDGYDYVRGDRPVIGEGGIYLNGWGDPEATVIPDGDDLICESFVITPTLPRPEPRDSDGWDWTAHHRAWAISDFHGGTWGDSCKTERDDYDLAVAAILLRAKLAYPRCFAIRSDGRWENEWLNGAMAWAGSPCEPGVGARGLVAALFDAPELMLPTCPRPLGPFKATP